MSKKSTENSDSLELLLDTMCNTFGGVMFIAIALVIISTFIPKITKDIDAESTNDMRIAELQAEIEQLHLQIKKQQISISLKNELVEKYKNSPYLDKIRELGRLKDENAKLILLTAEEKSAEINTMIALRKVKKKNARLNKILTQQNLDLRELTDDLTLLGGKIKKEQKILADLTVAVPVETRTIGLAPLSVTEKTPFVVVIDNNKLYRVNDNSGELVFDGNSFNSSSDVQMEPILSEENETPVGALIRLLPGKGVTINPSSDNRVALAKIFTPLDKTKKFISLEVNKNSFAGFIKVKEFLRKNGFTLYWFPAEKYQLMFGKCEYRAR